MIVWVSVVLKGTVLDDSDCRCFNNLEQKSSTGSTLSIKIEMQIFLVFLICTQAKLLSY